MFDTSDEARVAALSAFNKGWSLTLRDLESGAYGNASPTGYMHATLKVENGTYMLLSADGSWSPLDSLERLTYGRRARHRVARALVAWLDESHYPDDASRWALTGEGTCEACGRTLTASVARGFTLGPVCGGRVKPTLAERRGWNKPLAALLQRAEKQPVMVPTTPTTCNGTCDVGAYCPDCDA